MQQKFLGIINVKLYSKWDTNKEKYDKNGRKIQNYYWNNLHSLRMVEQYSAW
jgi:hypothetical protein